VIIPTNLPGWSRKALYLSESPFFQDRILKQPKGGGKPMTELEATTLDAWKEALSETVGQFIENYRVESAALAPPGRRDQICAFLAGVTGWTQGVQDDPELDSPDLPAKTSQGDVANEAALAVFELSRVLREELEVPDDRKAEVIDFLRVLLDMMRGEFFPGVPRFLRLMLEHLSR